MTRTSAPAENNDARLGTLDPFGDGREHIGTRKKTLGGRWNFGGLACHSAPGGFSHRCAWTL
jgi:hypothetical protein